MTDYLQQLPTQLVRASLDTFAPLPDADESSYFERLPTEILLMIDQIIKEASPARVVTTFDMNSSTESPPTRLGFITFDTSEFPARDRVLSSNHCIRYYKQYVRCNHVHVKKVVHCPGCVCASMLNPDSHVCSGILDTLSYDINACKDCRPPPPDYSHIEGLEGDFDYSSDEEERRPIAEGDEAQYSLITEVDVDQAESGIADHGGGSWGADFDRK
ncbi:hypothetical protein HYFRA_00013837 [Hymenoscyphus fraxineus]|uniref:Uncharacterized protein n=1 Tax=Hymenoscyphus fraxineus TaxID=746836 RepID=A0A9N9LC58_9HELO|nr:hypothetical protein HYFRA_00013837 [Hymenoscyphus fraxineus]